LAGADWGVVAVLLWYSTRFGPKICDGYYILRIESNQYGVQIHISPTSDGSSGGIIVRKLGNHTDTDIRTKLSLALTAKVTETRVMLEFPDSAAACGQHDMNICAITINLKRQGE
jgi:hypothetical protein